ncbi:acetate--CoA ligase family protein [Natrinema soli]|uniref:acetate--CoA ligase (ADP-forming) n=1 Tax=Natrinema soli TaxID=1930624 RepID=A0ABD5SIZ7_9EURY|nr:acetate--CoA ligase family protein [Natrinema soli]
MPSVFSPDSIAVIGASSNPDRIAGRPIAYLHKHGYEGDIYPVNPSHDEVAGLECYPDIRSVPTVPDFAMVILPADLVLDVVEDCADIGVETVLIVSSGFSETGDEDDAEAERRLAELNETTETSIIGPNSQGLINFPEKTTASFTPALQRDEIQTGPVSFVTQSGAFGGALTTLLQESSIGLNKWVATGNEAGLESLDFASLLAADDTTEIVAGYLEGFDDGRKLIELKRSDEGIDLPIVALKAGRSERGKTAAASHTGKMAGQHAVYKSVFEETGVIDVDDVDLFIDVIKTLTQLKDDEYPGSQLGVITTSGGAGIHIADVADDLSGVSLPDISDGVRTELNKHVPSYGSTFNPVDITAQVVNSPETFRECLRLLLDANEIETLVIQLTNASGDRATHYAEVISEMAADADTPLFVVWTGGLDRADGLEIYDRADVPVFENPARCIRTIAAVSQFDAARSRLEDAKSLPARPRTPNDGDHDGAPAVLSETDAKSVLDEYGISIPDGRLVTSADEAGNAADQIGYPVVAKLISPDVQHRNRIDGVRLDLESRRAVETAFEEINSIGDQRDIEVTGVSIQQQVPSGLELGMGIVTDTDFGPVVMLGRGGVDIETVDDVAFRTIPMSCEQARSMLDELETVSVDDLTESQLNDVVDCLVGLSEIYCDNPWIVEADVNPLVVGDEDVSAVDALFIGPN